VTAHDPGFFGPQEKTVFEAYGGPFLTTMQVEGSTLVLLTNDGHPQRIELDLQHLAAFLEDIIRYHRSTLRQGNAFYQEPAFIKTQRESTQKVDLETAQRRQQ
jgi:hypothetical protein